MMGHTHILAGMCAGLGVAAYMHASPLDSLVLAGLAGAAALLPDIDHPKADIRRRLGLLGTFTFGWLSHRGITHTWLLALVLGALALLTLPSPVALALIAGYSSHLIADMATRSGLPVFWPLTNERFFVLPYPLRVRTGSVVESLLDVGMMAIIGGLLAPLLK